MRRQKVLAAAAAFAMAFAIVATAPVAAAPKKFRATRPFVVDAQTGATRMPTTEEVDSVVTTLSTLAARPESLPEATAPDGTVTIDLAGGFGGVVLARPGGNGTWETRCVFTLEEGAEFLGLVEIVE